MPVTKKQFIPNDQTASTVVAEEPPPGPGPDTVLRSAALHVSHKPSKPSANDLSSQNPIMAYLTGPSRHAPARSRANPKGKQASTVSGRSSVAARPSSASTAGANVAPLHGDLVSNFEQELQEIGRIHDEERAGRRAKSSMEMTYPSPTPGGATAPSPSPSSMGPGPDQFEIDETNEAAHGRASAVGKPIHVPYSPDLRARVSASTALHTHLAPKPLNMRDYQLLAEACQRAGRARMEGHAYFKIGEVLTKEKETMHKSITYFKRYLNICRRLNDLQGEAKALNCLGIVHQQMAGENNVHIALEYHRQHAEIADAAGIYIANTNMGLIFSKVGDLQSSIECHKQALQYAVRAGDKQAESLALANLGVVGTQQGDLSTARVCVERHLDLATTLQDDNAACDAYTQLGVLAVQRQDFSVASENFVLALDIAVRQNNQEKACDLRCRVGYAQAMLRMEEHVKGACHGMLPSRK